MSFTNLLGVLPGESPEANPILLAAHYDTCDSYPGADDNAAAIAILLETIPKLKEAGLERPLVYAFFDSEEPPYFHTPSMGSMHFYRHQRKGDINFALVLDLVGHDVPIPGASDALFLTGMESDPKLEEIVRSSAHPGLKTISLLTKYLGDMSDYRAFRLAERPYLFFTCGHWEHYHCATDTPEKLNYEKMACVGDYLCEIVMKVDRAGVKGPFEGYDTTRTEIEMFNDAFAPMLGDLGGTITSREGLTMAIRTLRQRYGI